MVSNLKILVRRYKKDVAAVSPFGSAINTSTIIRQSHERSQLRPISISANPSHTPAGHFYQSYEHHLWKNRSLTPIPVQAKRRMIRNHRPAACQ